MREKDNVQVIRDAYAAFVRGDMPVVLEAFAPDIAWHAPGPKEAPYAGSRHGRDEVAQFFELVAQHVEFTVFEPREYVAQGDHVVALGHYAGRIRGTGKPFASQWAMAWTMRGGKATGFREYTDTQTLGAAYRS